MKGLIAALGLLAATAAPALACPGMTTAGTHQTQTASGGTQVPPTDQQKG
ncbi:hypothetical protein NPA31_019285 [Aurantimonas sp. MSK8Z-1]|nr:hypothetical protein [Aurantimonas sp. MSK8Z-1]MCW4117107.1 hypothetical protein [Aurantimonas sp. MSK8Z-1]